MFSLCRSWKSLGISACLGFGNNVMASNRPSPWADSSPHYQSIVQKAEAELLTILETARISEPDEIRAMLSVFCDAEADSRRFPNSPDRLVKAILAGQKLVMHLSEDKRIEPLRTTLPPLIDLLARRSQWHQIERRSDLEQALGLAQQWRDSDEGEATYLEAIRKLAELHEEMFLRYGDEVDLSRAIDYLVEVASHTEGPARESAFIDAACLRFKSNPDALKRILEIPFSEVPHKTVAWTNVSRKKFRFIDARSFAARKSLRVLEFDVLPKRRYVNLSYVWRGSHAPGTLPPNMETMTVEGAVGADPISIEVLVSICKCVAMFDCELIWIDGVCIIQNDPEDKSWQIQNMFDIYKHCKKCLIVPGGLSRLAPLTESTSWLHRAWTLQEALAPDSCVVLFSWTLGDCVLQTHLPCFIREVEPGKAAQAALDQLLIKTLGIEARVLTAPSFSSQVGSVDVKIFGNSTEKAQAVALLGALDYRGREGMGNAIWRSALMRVASRPADTVFSMMGIMGVSLNPLDFDTNDRVGPTIALMQALLRKGEQAEWLGAAPQMLINEKIPTLPQFPKVSPEGKAVAKTRSGLVPISEAMGDTWWRLVNTPKGDMHDDGTMLIRAPVISVRTEQVNDDDMLLDKITGVRNQESTWYVCQSERGPPYAVQVGKKEEYTNAMRSASVNPWPFLLMIVEEASPGSMRNVAYATVGQAAIDTPGWLVKDIILAGVQRLERSS